MQKEWDALEALNETPPEDLLRPWEPSTCQSLELRAELATWLGEFVGWLNQQHAWDPDDRLPGCWEQHPHLVHDLAVVADLRLRAGRSSAELEHWHRNVLPAFRDRTRRALRQHCAAGHRQIMID